MRDERFFLLIFVLAIHVLDRCVQIIRCQLKENNAFLFYAMNRIAIRFLRFFFFFFFLFVLCCTIILYSVFFFFLLTTRQWFLLSLHTVSNGLYINIKRSVLCTQHALCIHRAYSLDLVFYDRASVIDTGNGSEGYYTLTS